MVVVGLVVLVVVVESPVLGCPHDIIDIQATDRQNLSVCRTPPRHDQVSSAVSNDCRNRRRSPGNKKEEINGFCPFSRFFRVQFELLRLVRCENS